MIKIIFGNKKLLNEAYSQGLVNRLREKFKKENSNLTDQIIDYYVDIFDKNKDGEKIKTAPKGNDILRYSWDELEKIIDANFSTASAGETKIQTDMKPVYQSEDQTLQIFLGDVREKCVSIRQNFEGRTGQSYGWCISKNDSGNMFHAYRYRLNEPVFYYVFDSERTKDDIYHAVVIYPDSKGIFNLATAKNPGDIQQTWEEISRKMPKLKNLKLLFKHIPLTEKEKRVYSIVKEKMNDEKYSNLSYDLKEAYISFGHGLTDNQLYATWKTNKDWINKYCSMNEKVFIPLDIYNKLPNATKKVIQDGFKREPQQYDLYYLRKTEFVGSLYLDGTQITSLPDNLKVGGDLVLAGTQITSLPDNLKVGGSLVLNNTPITSLPDNLKVGGDLYLAGTQITSLPDNLKVGGSLVLNNTQITSLPDNLKVGGSLVLNNTQITSLPDNLEVGGDLYPNKFYIMYRKIESKRQTIKTENKKRIIRMNIKLI